MSFRRVNWDNFKTGGHDSRAKVKFQPPKQVDRRDNSKEVQISNGISRYLQTKKQNELLFESLPPARQEQILELLKQAG